MCLCLLDSSHLARDSSGGALTRVLSGLCGRRPLLLYLSSRRLAPPPRLLVRPEEGTAMTMRSRLRRRRRCVAHVDSREGPGEAHVLCLYALPSASAGGVQAARAA